MMMLMMMLLVLLVLVMVAIRELMRRGGRGPARKARRQPAEWRAADLLRTQRLQ